MTTSLWRNRDFMVLWSGRTLSEVGDAVSLLAIPLLAVTVLDATAVEVGILSATRMVAYLFLSLPAGVWVDRMRKRRVMVVCHLVRAGLVATVAVGAWAGWVTMAHLWIVALLSSVCTVLYETAHQSFLPAVVPGGQLLEANGKLATTYAVSRIAGYSVGGALASALGVARTVGVDALAYLVNAASLLFIRRAEDPPAAAGPRDFRRELAAGLSFVFRHPIMPRLVAASASLNLFSQMIFALAVLYLVRDLRLDEHTVGVVLALTTLGGIGGGARVATSGARSGDRIGLADRTLLAQPVGDERGPAHPARPRPGVGETGRQRRHRRGQPGRPDPPRRDRPVVPPVQARPEEPVRGAGLPRGPVRSRRRSCGAGGHPGDVPGPRRDARGSG